ncbi:MAG TPA: tetratricopeptide repeat protein [Methylomirabilota bacterium]|nr:tetratricopeptide repeat protein [Methylomirabilota bacterium]
MIVRLSDSLARALVVLASVLVGAWLSFYSLRAAVAQYGADGTSQRRLELATRLEPGNPTYWYALARFHEYNLENPNPQLAEELYRKAISLDPQYTDAWMDLGTAYELEGRNEEAGRAFHEAKKSYPSSADVSWRYGNFLLRQGDQVQAYSELKRAIAADPNRAAAAFSRAYRSNPDIQQILDELLPARADVYLPVIRTAADAKQLAVAQTVWNALMTLHPKLTFRDIDSLAGPLLQNREYLEARRVWDEGVAMMDLPPLLQPQLSVVWDPSFESGASGSAYSWHFRPLDQGVSIGFDKAEHTSGGGQQSLRLSFDGKHNPDLDAACTQVNVQPSTNYYFSGWIKTRDLTTESGIQFRIRGYYSKTPDALSTREIHGTNPWTEVELDWTSAPDAHLAQICVRREASENPDVRISGAAWVDDVNLVPKPAGTRRP